MRAAIEQHAGIGAVVEAEAFCALEAMQGDVAARRLVHGGTRLAPEPGFPRDVERGAAIVADTGAGGVIRCELNRKDPSTHRGCRQHCGCTIAAGASGALQLGHNRGTRMLDRRQLLGSAAALGAASFITRAFAADDEAARLNALLDAFFQVGLRQNPEQATLLGLDKGPNAGLRSKLRDESATGEAAR